MDLNSYDYSDLITFEEKDKIWDLIYSKISAGIENKKDSVLVFDGLIAEKDQYEIFLLNFILWSEKLERYEKCNEVKKTINKLKEWIEKN